MTYSRLATPKATRALLDAYGLSTKKSLGQHFLVDDNVVGRILTLADIERDDVVLEVGPGIGTLTVALLKRAGFVIAIERDRDLLPLLAETTAQDSDRFALLNKDATAVGGEDVTAALSKNGKAPNKFVANLPYAVAATLVLKYFEEMPTLQSATVMVQSEVADRMCAQPGTKTYGSYTVKLNLIARPCGRFQVSRNSFFPPPRVDSAVVRFDRDPLSDDVALLSLAARLADGAFAQRRKTIRNSMRASLPIPIEELDRAFDTLGIDPICRGETLSPGVYLDLARQLRESITD